MDVLGLLERLQTGTEMRCPDCNKLYLGDDDLDVEHKPDCELKAAIDDLRSGRLQVVAGYVQHLTRIMRRSKYERE